jgi:hypothetical protein
MRSKLHCPWNATARKTEKRKKRKKEKDDQSHAFKAALSLERHC